MAIDWSDFNDWPEDTCYCRCGAIFRSHSKYVLEMKAIITRKPCPECGLNDDCRGIQSDPESMTI